MSSSQENVNESHEGTPEDVPSAECNTDADFFGPSLPPHLLNKTSHKSKSEKIYGPNLPINFSKKEEVQISATIPTLDEKNQTLIGPELPEHLKSSASTTLDVEEEVTPGASDDNYGPSTTLMTTGDVTDYYKFKIAQTPNKESASESGIERETWMIELPEKKKANFGLFPRHFKSRIPTDKESDSSVWTETPADKKRKQKHNEKDSKEILKKKRLQERDKEMEKLAKKAAKKLRKKESLLEIHQRNLKTKEKKEAERRQKEGETLRERRPFDRNIDLQIQRVDENRKRAMLSKSVFLNDRFAPGESKFL